MTLGTYAEWLRNGSAPLIDGDRIILLVRSARNHMEADTYAVGEIMGEDPIHPSLFQVWCEGHMMTVDVNPYRQRELWKAAPNWVRHEVRDTPIFWGTSWR